MKTFTLSIISFVLGSVLAGGAAAQAAAPAPAAPKAQKHCGCLVKALNLTDDQKAKIKEIRQQAKADAAKATDKQAKMDIWKAAREKINTTVLTDEQRTKLAQIRKMHEHWMAFRSLNLTDDQKAKVKEIMQQARADAAKVTDKQAKVDIWKAAREKINTTVLTEEQRKQLEQYKAQHKGPAPAAHVEPKT